MHIDAGPFAHDTLDSHEISVHPVQVILLVPNVTIHLFLEGLHLFDVKFLLSLTDGISHFGVAAHIDLLGIVGSRGERRVNINEVNRDATIFQISTC